MNKNIFDEEMETRIFEGFAFIQSKPNAKLCKLKTDELLNRIDEVEFNFKQLKSRKDHNSSDIVMMKDFDLFLDYLYGEKVLLRTFIESNMNNTNLKKEEKDSFVKQHKSLKKK